MKNLINPIRISIFFFFIFFLWALSVPSAISASSKAKKVKAVVKANEGPSWIFDENLAFKQLKKQVSFGPRYVSSPGHKKAQEYLQKTLQKYVTGKVIVQKWDHKEQNGHTSPLANILARFAPELTQRILLASHYDSKQFANQDQNPQLRQQPVLGANDSGSGTAILLEMARNLSLLEKRKELKIGVDLIFIDGEEGEFVSSSKNKKSDVTAWVWRPLGSLYLAEHIKEIYPNRLPVNGIVIDMVGDKDLNLYIELNSFKYAPEPVKAIWKIGQNMAPHAFLPEGKYNIIDDHMPLNNVGIPSMLIIDFDYPSWHTTQDTLDKCDPKSLKIVGQTLLDYLKQQNSN